MNLVKESLLSMVRIMFAHAARFSIPGQSMSAHHSGHTLYTSGPIPLNGSNNSLAGAPDSFAESSERLQGRGGDRERPGSGSVGSSSRRTAAATAESLEEERPGPGSVGVSSRRMAAATAESLEEEPVPMAPVSQSKHDRSSEGYGQPAAGHILLFLIKLVRVEPMRVFALDLIQEAASAGGSPILKMPLLLRRLQVRLALCHVYAVHPACTCPYILREGLRVHVVPLHFRLSAMYACEQVLPVSIRSVPIPLLQASDRRGGLPSKGSRHTIVKAQPLQRAGIVLSTALPEYCGNGKQSASHAKQ